MNDIIIIHLQKNLGIFRRLLLDIPNKEMYLWKPNPDRWSLLEILCHLYDEERLDFKFRIKHALEKPGKTVPDIEPELWVQQNEYIKQDYRATLEKFSSERTDSVLWLKSLGDVNWNNAIDHKEIGELSARSLLVNWLSHDYLHMRQIIKLKYDYIKNLTGEDLGYAGVF